MWIPISLTGGLTILKIFRLQSHNFLTFVNFIQELLRFAKYCIYHNIVNGESQNYCEMFDTADKEIDDNSVKIIDTMESLLAGLKFYSISYTTEVSTVIKYKWVNFEIINLKQLQFQLFGAVDT